MNFTFEIASRTEAEATLLGLSGEPFPDHVISIGDPGVAPPRGFAKFPGRKLRLEFVDLCTKDDDDVFSHYEWRRPEPGDVERIIEFAGGVKGGHLLVHCQAGISRSSAAVLIVMATQMKPKSASVMEMQVLIKRPIARPNDLMLEYADEQLGWGGALAKLGGNFQRVRSLWYGVG